MKKNEIKMLNSDDGKEEEEDNSGLMYWFE